MPDPIVAYVPVTMPELVRWAAERQQWPAAPCYSDHDEDIRTKGSCDMCGGTEREEREDARE